MCLVVVKEKHFSGKNRDLHVLVLTFFWSVSMEIYEGYMTLNKLAEHLK